MTDQLRRTAAQTRAPVRMVHLGLGNFFRAHQAWYTAQAPDAGTWGFAAFTGRRPDNAEALAPQGGLYTLITRGPEQDEFDVVPSVSAVHPASDHDAWLDYLADPNVAIVTITMTEAAYMRGSDGALDTSNVDVVADIQALKNDPRATVSTTPGRLTAGLMARQAAGGGPITLLSCDNLPGNGAVVSQVVSDFVRAVAPDIADWVSDKVDFASSMVDRITPSASDADQELVAENLNVHDASPVVTEPFTEWVIAGTFPAGRPRWDEVGVQIVDDVEPFENRKLLMLNGAHSLLAYAGSALGHETVSEAIGDDRCRTWVNQLWDNATELLEVPREEIADYRQALLDRFGNHRMKDYLARIAMDGSQKIPVRIVPVVKHHRASGNLPEGAVVALAAWIAHLRGHGAPIRDAHGDEWQQTAAGNDAAAVSAVLGKLEIGDDPELANAVAEKLAVFEGE